MTERTPRIDSMTITRRRARKPAPKLGDRKVIKGVLHERRMKLARDAQGRVIGYDCTGGRQRYEWVLVEGDFHD